MKKLNSLREIVDYYIRKGVVLGVNEENFRKIQRGDKKLIDRVLKENHGMIFRPESKGEFYVL